MHNLSAHGQTRTHNLTHHAYVQCQVLTQTWPPRHLALREYDLNIGGYRGYIGIMEKKMETTIILGVIGVV